MKDIDSQPNDNKAKSANTKEADKKPVNAKSMKPEKSEKLEKPEKPVLTGAEFNYRVTQVFVFSLTVLCFVSLLALSLVSQFWPSPYNESLKGMVDVCRNITTTGFGIATGLLTARP